MGAMHRPIAWDTRRPIGKVMVVDDEVLVRVSICKVLAESGLEAIQAGDGLEALQQYQAHREDISLVIMDAGMPRMGGAETAQIIRELDPSAKVILTGSAGAPEPGMDALLAKPFTLGSFCEVLQRVLKVERRHESRQPGPKVTSA